MLESNAIYEISEENNHAWREVNVTVSNLPPVAYIDSISPSPAVDGDNVAFIGYDTDDAACSKKCSIEHQYYPPSRIKISALIFFLLTFKTPTDAPENNGCVGEPGLTYKTLSSSFTEPRWL